MLFLRKREDESDDDRDLIADFLARKPAALEKVYKRHGNAMYSVARRVLGSGNDAEDCVHDVLMRVWVRPQSYRRERGDIRAYLLSSVRNEAISRQRTFARHARIDASISEVGTFGQPDPEVVDHIELARLHEAIKQLPLDQRTALERAFFGRQTHGQISTTLGVPLGTIKSRISMAIRKLDSLMRSGEKVRT